MPVIDPELVCTPPIAALARLGTPQVVAARGMIVAEGEVGDCLYVLLAGQVRIFVDDDDTRRFVIGRFGPGTLFGEGSLDGGLRTASVQALTACTCSVVPYAVLRDRMESDGRFGVALVMELIRRGRHTVRRMKGLALDSAYQRLRELLTNELPAGVGRLAGEWSQQELADRIGCSRDMVTRMLKELAKGGYVITGRRQLELRKPLPRDW